MATSEIYSIIINTVTLIAILEPISYHLMTIKPLGATASVSGLLL